MGIQKWMPILFLTNFKVISLTELNYAESDAQIRFKA